LLVAKFTVIKTYATYSGPGPLGPLPDCRVPVICISSPSPP